MTDKILIPIKNISNSRHPLCAGYRNEWTGEFDCDYNTKITCDDCKYGVGRKDPNAKRNQLE